MLKHYHFLVILHCFHRLLNSNCSSCFHIFPNKLVNRLTSNLMGAIHWGTLWVCFVDFMSFPELWSVKMFLQIIGKPLNRFDLCVMCKCEGWIHWNTPQVWLAFGYTLLIPSVSCPLVSRTVFAHLQTNSSLWNSSDLINSWSLCWIHTLPLSPIGEAIFVHLQAHCWSDWHEIWWVNRWTFFLSNCNTYLWFLVSNRYLSECYRYFICMFSIFSFNDIRL